MIEKYMLRVILRHLDLEMRVLLQQKFLGTNITRGCNFSAKCTRNCLAAGLRPDPLGELTALPQTP